MNCETNFLSILENFFQSCRIFGGKSISAIKTVLGAITQPPAQSGFFFTKSSIARTNFESALTCAIASGGVCSPFVRRRTASQLAVHHSELQSAKKNETECLKFEAFEN